MIDFNKELQKLEFFQIDEQFINIKNETSILFSSFTGLTNRLDKKLADISTNVEEIFSIVEDESKSSIQLTNDLDIEKSEHTRDVQAFISAIISVADMIEDMCVFAAQSNDASFKQQTQIMWGNLCNTLSGLNIVCIRGENTAYNPFLQTIAQVENSGDEPNETVLQVLRSGYIYNNKVIRKASVIVKGDAL